MPKENLNFTESTGDTIVVLGGGGKRRVLGLIEYIKEHPEIKRIIFSGGKTGGPHNPSEAENMKEFFLRKHKGEVPNILTENESRDTEENAEKTAELIKGVAENIERVMLMSDTTHLPRAGWSFERNGIPTKRISAEYWLSKRSKHHKKYVRKLFFSRPYIKQTFIVEPLAHVLSSFEKGRKYMRQKTQGRG